MLQRVILFILLAFAALVSSEAQDRLKVDVQFLYKHKSLSSVKSMSSVHVYRLKSNGQMEYYGQSDGTGHMIDPIEVSRVGTYVFRYILNDRVRFDTNRRWEIYDGGTWRDASLDEVERTGLVHSGEFKVDCTRESGRSTKPIEIYLKERQAEDVFLIASHEAGEALTTASRKVRTGFGPQGSDGSRQGDYENFSVRFSVPKRQMKPHYRIVAQPVWVDADLGLTYYGDPLVFYNRRHYITVLRDSYFEVKDHQDGMLFYDDVPLHNGLAYSPDRGPAESPFADYTLTHREELHHPTRTSEQVDPDRYYFNLPFYIKVADHMATNDCQALVRWVVTDYDHIISEHCDTVILGRNDPLRFLRYNVGGFMERSGRYEADRYWFPPTGEGIHNEKADLRLFYESGKTSIDWANPRNAAELSKVDSMVGMVLSTEGVDVRDVQICGYASPEGRFDHNRALAASRASNFAAYVGSRIPRLRQFVHTSSDVVPWTLVADTLRSWGHYPGELGQEATEAQLHATVGPEQLKQALDAVRLTSFNLVYEYSAPYTPEQLLSKWQQHALSAPFMYHQVYRYLAEERGDWTSAERVCQEQYDRVAARHQAELATMRQLAAKPSWTAEDSLALKRTLPQLHELVLYANDLCAIKLHRGEADTALLHPLICFPISFRDQKYAGVEVGFIPGITLLNQASAYLLKRRFSMARGLMNYYAAHYSDGSTRVAELSATISDLMEINTSAQNITPECIDRLAKIDSLNRTVCILAKTNATSEELLHARDVALSAGHDSVATCNVIRALCFGRRFITENETYKPTAEHLYDSNLLSGATYLNMALKQDPSLRSALYSQRDLKPLFSALTHVRQEERILKSIRITRRNKDKTL